jgi:hypothetical protein
VPSSELVTSFSSKSEPALNLSPDGRYVSFVGYVAAPDTLDVDTSGKACPNGGSLSRQGAVVDGLSVRVLSVPALPVGHDRRHG